MNYQKLVARMSLEEKCYLMSGKDFWQSRSVGRLGIPNITLSDGPHGIRKQEGASDQLGLNGSIPATCYPTAATVANSWNPELGEEIGRYLGNEAAEQEVAVLLGPGMNIKRSPLCGRNFEYFSEDPYLTGKMAAGYIRGIQENGIAACPKHFAVNSQELRRMASDSVVDERTLREIYLAGFEIAVKEAHPKAIMTSYNQVNGVYANENYHLLQEILRDEWGFDGFAVSDWGASNNHVEGVWAGSHLEMPTTGGDSDEELIRAVKEGKISEALLDQRVGELLDVIFSVHKAVEEEKKNGFSKEKRRNMAQKAAEESIVLLKNENQILPLQENTRVAVIGEFAQNPRYQGAGSSVVNSEKLDSAMGVIHQFPLRVEGYAAGYHRSGPPDPVLEREAVELAKKAEAVLLYIGLDEVSESEGLDRTGMKIPESQIRLLEKISQVNPNVAAVLSAGSAVEMPWIKYCKSVIHGGLCGQAGAKAMLRAIIGEVNPSGKLSETYPLKYEDVSSASYFPSKERTAEYREGIFVGYRYFDTAKIPVLFPFGYGLSYTTFSYSNLKADKEKAVFDITNTGSRDGAEIAQMYVSAKCTGVYRPQKELKGFKKVFLKAGETKTVEIPVSCDAFRYFNVKTNAFEVESGKYEILIGSSVEDIHLSKTIDVAGTGAPLPYNMSRLKHYASGDIKNIPDCEFKELLGHAIPNGHWKGQLERNDAICQMYYAKSRLARLIYRIMTNLLDKSMARGKPNLNLMFNYNMPFRAIGKMAGGICSQEMVDGIVIIVNGHFFKGFGQVVRGFFRQQKVRKKAKTMN